MTLVSTLISNAFRESNIIPIVGSPSSLEQTEALDRLNNIYLSTIGNEVGDKLKDINIGGQFDETTLTTDWVPSNARLVLNLTEITGLSLDPEPYEGQRLAVADASGNLATYNLLLYGNGRTIEGLTTLTLDTDGYVGHWLYRGDTANWIKITTLVPGDTFPLPQEFDDYFITTLAVRLNPRYGQTLTNETMEALKRSKRQIQARYRSDKSIYPEYIGVLGQRGRTFNENEHL